MDDELVVSQRIRNSIIDHLSLLGTPSDIVDYQERVGVNVVNELFEQWYDNVDFRVHLIEDFTSPTYTEEERVSILKVSSVMEYTLDKTEEEFPDLKSFLVSDHYQLVRSVAIDALSIFMNRGKLSSETPDI